VTDQPVREELRRSMEEILRTAIEREADSYDYYHSAALETADPELRAFLMGLAEMEKEHSRRLREELEKLENLRWLQSTVTC
jgi:rubrerythrin